MTEATSNTSALLPCPFCGSTDVEIDGKPAILDAPDSVSCNQCTAGAPIHAWQGRTAPPAAAVAMPAYSDERGSDGELTYEAKARNAALDEVARLNPAPAEQSAMVVPEGWHDEAKRCAFVMRHIGSMGDDEIEGDNLDLRFEDAGGRESGCDVSITEYAERTANLIESLLAAAPAPEQPAKEVQ